MYFKSALALAAAFATLAAAGGDAEVGSINNGGISFGQPHRYGELRQHEVWGYKYRQGFQQKIPGEDAQSEYLRKGLQELDDTYRRHLSSQDKAAAKKLSTLKDSLKDSPTFTVDDGALKVQTDSVMATKYEALYKKWRPLVNKMKAGNKLSEKEQASYEGLEKTMSFYEDMFSQQNARMMQRIHGIEGRFGKWNKFTGTFANEDTLYGNLRKAVGPPKDPVAIDEAISKLGGIDVAAEYMRKSANAIAASDRMIQYITRRPKSWFGRIMQKYGFGRNYNADREAMLQKYLKTKEADMSKPKVPSALEDQVRGVRGRAVQVAEGYGEQPKGFATKIGDNFGRLNAQDAGYLADAANQRSEAVKLGMASDTDSVKLAEMLLGPVSRYSIAEEGGVNAATKIQNSVKELSDNAGKTGSAGETVEDKLANIFKDSGW